MKRWEKVVWDGLFMFRRERSTDLWENLTWFKLGGRILPFILKKNKKIKNKNKKKIKKIKKKTLGEGKRLSNTKNNINISNEKWYVN